VQEANRALAEKRREDRATKALHVALIRHQTMLAQQLQWQRQQSSQRGGGGVEKQVERVSLGEKLEAFKEEIGEENYILLSDTSNFTLLFEKWEEENYEI